MKTLAMIIITTLFLTACGVFVIPAPEPTATVGPPQCLIDASSLYDDLQEALAQTEQNPSNIGLLITKLNDYEVRAQALPCAGEYALVKTKTVELLDMYAKAYISASMGNSRSAQLDINRAEYLEYELLTLTEELAR